MEMPWVILSRVILGPGPDDLDAEEEQDAAAVDAQEEHAAVVEADAAAELQDQAEDAAAAGEPEPDISGVVFMPPRVTILAAGPGAHPDANNPDQYPYIVAAGRFCLLAHFAAAPNHATCFDNEAQYPERTRLVLVRDFQTAEGVTTATAELVPFLWKIGSVGILSDGVREIIAELLIGPSGESAALTRFQDGQWYSKSIPCLLPRKNRRRRWVSHGAVTVDSSICWFDLSWGILSCDLGQPEEELELDFLPLPRGRELEEATPGIYSTRCITVTQDGKLRYVEIAPVAGEAAPTVTMWTRVTREDDDGWEWDWNNSYTMSFGLIWDDDSYTATGLPRDVVPELALVSPSNHHIVYFALERNIFGVNVPLHRVEHIAAYDLVNMPGPPRPASSRYLVPWTLPEEVAEALGYAVPNGVIHPGEGAGHGAL